MSLPDPVPGLVISYSYLWRNEARHGHEEGRKDRPCVIVLSVQNRDGQTIVTVAPMTHTPPASPDIAIEIPARTKERLGLDGAPSWVIVADLNRFVWPGVDLRPTARGKQAYAYGLLPAALYAQVRDKVLALARTRRAVFRPRED